MIKKFFELINILVFNRLRRQLGITLVEAIIYVSLTALVLTGFISFSLTVAGLKNKNYVWSETNGNSQVILSLISREIRQAEAIVNPLTGQASSTLILATASGTKIIFSRDGILKIKLNGTELGTLNSRQTTVSDLVFTNLSSLRGPGNIGFSFILNSQQGDSSEFTAIQNFRAAVSLRK